MNSELEDYITRCIDADDHLSYGTSITEFTEGVINRLEPWEQYKFAVTLRSLTKNQERKLLGEGIAGMTSMIELLEKETQHDFQEYTLEQGLTPFAECLGVYCFELSAEEARGLQQCYFVGDLTAFVGDNVYW